MFFLLPTLPITSTPLWLNYLSPRVTLETGLAFVEPIFSVPSLLRTLQTFVEE